MASSTAVQRLLGCNVYISEGRNLQLIRRLEVIIASKAICRQQPRSVLLAHTFVDEPYNRTGLTLTSASIPELVSTVTALAHFALDHIDLSTHHAQHPRLGVLDHVSLHPLGLQASLALAAEAAAALGHRLAAAPLNLPVYFYGAAHPGHRRLAEVRRKLGYFQPTAASTTPTGSSTHCTGSSGTSTGPQAEPWAGSVRQLQALEYPPDVGPSTAAAAAAAGVVTIGAVPWVTNFNVPLFTSDMAAARAVARAVSTRGGGLPGVEAMALSHGPGVIEVATNLVGYQWNDAAANAQRDAAELDNSCATGATGSSSSSGADMQEDTAIEGSCGPQAEASGVQAGAGPREVALAVAEQAQLCGLPAPGEGYITNKTPAELLAYAAQHFA